MAGESNIALVVEDDPQAADALSLVLQDLGIDVLCGLHEEALLESLGPRAHQVAWIIADYHLGATMDGVTLASRLHARMPAARVLVLSGVFSNQAHDAARRAGYPFAQKPASAESIAAWLAQQ